MNFIASILCRMDHFEEHGKNFLQNYYSALQSNRAALAACYTMDSFITYNGQRMKGTSSIMEKINGLPQIVGFNIASVECQPTKDMGILALVDGELKLQDEEHALRFMEIFSLSFVGGKGQINNQIFSVGGGGSH